MDPGECHAIRLLTTIFPTPQKFILCSLYHQWTLVSAMQFDFWQLYFQPPKKLYFASYLTNGPWYNPNLLSKDNINISNAPGSQWHSYLYERDKPCRWVGFDDVDSIRLKAQFVNSRGLAGSMVWWEIFLSFHEKIQNNELHLPPTIFPFQYEEWRNCRSIESDDFRADYGPKYPLISEVFLLPHCQRILMCHKTLCIHT